MIGLMSNVSREHKTYGTGLKITSLMITKIVSTMRSSLVLTNGTPVLMSVQRFTLFKSDSSNGINALFWTSLSSLNDTMKDLIKRFTRHSLYNLIQSLVIFRRQSILTNAIVLFICITQLTHEQERARESKREQERARERARERERERERGERE